MKRTFLAWGFFFGLSGVILGAFAAHALKEVLNESQLDSFQTGVRYQMYHALLLILLSGFEQFRTKAILNLTVVGVTLFSFSIYFLNLREPLNIEALRYLGPITPIGGTLLIIAWVILLFKTLKSKTESL